MARENANWRAAYVEQLRIKTPSIETETGSLSGGNQQKVALARWLAIDPAVLILDEPTQGVDVGSKAEIHRLMVDLAEQGSRSDDLFRAAGDPGHERPDRGDAWRHDRRHAGARGSDAADRSCRWRWGTPDVEHAHRARDLARRRDCWRSLLVLAVVAPGFFTFANQRDLVLANMPVLIVALGMTLVILTGQIDISVGSLFAICSVAAGVFAQAWACRRRWRARPRAWPGALLGAINGALVAWVRHSVDRGDAGHHGGAARWPALDHARRVGAGPAAEFSVVRAVADGQRAVTIALAVALAVGIGWGLRNLAAGRAVYATGSDAKAARLAGIDPARVVFCGFRDHGRADRLRGAVERRPLQPDSRATPGWGWRCR